MSKRVSATVAAHFADLNAMIPKMNKLAEQLKEMYVEYTIKRETLRVYAARGIIPKEIIPTFRFPRCTDAVYTKRKERAACKKSLQVGNTKNNTEANHVHNFR